MPYSAWSKKKALQLINRLFIWAGLPPTDSFIVLVLAFFYCERLAGGIGVARAVVGAVLLFVFGLEQL